MAAGDLRELVELEELAEVDDGRGNTTTDWVARAKCAARFQYLRGSETVMQARLEGRQPIAVTVRQTPAVAQATPDWRIKDVRSGATWQIRSISPNERKSYVDLLCERGVPT